MSDAVRQQQQAELPLAQKKSQWLTCSGFAKKTEFAALLTLKVFLKV